MKLFTLFAALIIHISSYAQITLMQDSTDIKWMKIETELYEIIYPEHVEPQAQYITNLLKYYGPLVAKRYELDQKKISVVLRPNSADPNGFVTLAPRRSEWFMHTSFTPFIGSLEWYQSLAVHEYQHIVQFDFLNRSNLKIGYYLGGEALQGTFMTIAFPSWYFEGEAVWTETALSNAGRGRSPRFMSRLKALLTNDYPLTLDQLLAGDFDQSIPNHYVYGYAFITKAMLKYGENFWYHVTARATDEPINPYAIYNAFYEITGLSFDTFAQQTMEELKHAWGENKDLSSDYKFRTVAWPMQDQDKIYVLKKDLDHYWELVDIDSPDTPLGEFNISPGLSKTDLKNNKFLYAQTNPHYRYGFMSTSDLFIFDLKEKEHTQVTKDSRFYHPQFNQAGTKITAVEYTSKNEWHAVVLDTNGNLLKRIPSNKESKIVETIFKSPNELYAITLDPIGMKSISVINLDSGEINPISPKTRNNIFALNNADKLYFEADDMGSINIFAYNEIKEEFYKCTNEYIGGFSPQKTSKDLYYVSIKSFGREIKKADECKPIVKADIFKNYLADTPSDNLHKKSKVSDEKLISSLNHSVNIESYNEYSNSLSPHSWSYLLGRGSQFSITTTNNLGTLNINATLGTNPEESTPFGAVVFTYAKYYPLFSFGIGGQNRKIQTGTEDVTWKETELRFQTLMPYIYQNNLYQGENYLGFVIDQIQVSEKDNQQTSYELNNETLTGLGVTFQSSYLKQTIPKQIFSPWGYELTYFYEDFKTSGNNESLSYLGSYNLDMFAPGFGDHHGFKLSTSGEYRPENENLYRQQREYIPIIGYAFSRGYAYEFTPKFQRATLDYAFTLGYPNGGYKEWIYFNRIYSQIFVDHTLSEFNRGDRTLNSYGIEFYFDSLTFRKLPITYGLRFLNRTQDETGQAEFFLNLF